MSDEKFIMLCGTVLVGLAILGVIAVEVIKVLR